MSAATMSETQSSLSGHAIDVMDRFVAGLDDLAYEVAENIARRRNPSAKSVDIEVQDIQKAATLIYQGVQDAVARGQLSGQVESMIEGMQECFQTNGQGA